MFQEAPPASAADLDRLVDEALLSLRQHLAESSGPLFALIDPLKADTLEAWVEAQTQLNPAFVAPEKSRLQLPLGEASRHPYLLHLPDACVSDERLMNAVIRLAVEEALHLHDSDDANVRSICGWLIGRPQANQPELISQERKVLAHSLKQRAWVTPPRGAGVGPMLFRFFDPRITPYLPGILGAKWMSALRYLGVQRWLTIDGASQLVPVGPVNTDHSARAAAGPGWAFEQHEWDALTRLGWCNLVKHLMQHWEIAEPVSHSVVTRAVDGAWAWGWRSESDILRFAHCALTLHPEFDQYPPFREALAQLQQAGNADDSFARVVTELMAQLPADWPAQHTKES